MNNQRFHPFSIGTTFAGKLIIGFIVCTFLSFLINFLSQPNLESPFEDVVKDYIHAKGIRMKFRTADSLKLCKHFKASTTEFLQYVDEDDAEDLAYTLNQIIANYLALNQIRHAAEYLDIFDSRLQSQKLSSGALGDYYLNKGVFEQHTGKGQSSIANLKLALSHYDKTYPSDHQRKIQTLNELGLSYCFYSTKIDSFFIYVDSSYNLLNKSAKLNRYNPRVFYGQAHKSWYKKDHVTGETFCRMAIKYARDVPDYDTLFVAQSYAVKGRMLNKQKNQDSLALEAFLEAIEIGRKIKGKELRTQTLYDEIIKYFAVKKDTINFEKYLGRVESAYPPSDLVYIFPDRLRGYFNYWIDDKALATSYYKRFLDAYLKRTNRDFNILTEALTVIIESSIQFDRLAEAEQYVWKMINVIRNDEIDTAQPFKKLYSSAVFSKDYLYTSLDYLARIYKRGHAIEQDSVASLEKAFHLYTLIDTVIYDNIESFDEDAWLEFSKNYNERIYQSAIETAFLLYEQKKQTKILDWANHFIERLKAPLLYQELLIEQSQFFPEVKASFFKEEKELNRQIREQKQLREKRDEELFAELVRKRELLYLRLKDEYPRYYRAKVQQPFVRASDLQSALTSNREAIVNFFYGPSYFYTLTIHRDTILFERKEKAQEISSTSQWLNNYFSTPNQFKLDEIRIYQDSAFSLYNMLFSQLVHSFPNLETLTIIPAGHLNFTPFDALITSPKSDHENLPILNYLCKKYEIKLAFSAKAYLHQQSNPFKLGPNPKILAYAYARKCSSWFGNKNMTELAATAEELKAIIEFFPHAQKMLRYGPQSKKTHFSKQTDQGYDIYHFALHAYASSADRLENFMLFPKDSIYGYEIISMNLGGQLAILSSCETAFGSYEPGEGQYSLTRSFFLSGCNNVISSLWQAEDIKTAVLIRLFYDYLSQGKSPSKALHLAKREFLKQAGPETAHPYYWANLVSYG